MFVYTLYQEIKVSSERMLENLFKNVFAKEKAVDLIRIFILVIVALNVFFISLIIASLFFGVSVSEVLSIAQSISVLKTVRITLSSILCAITITVFIGVPTAYVLAREEGYIYRIIDIIISIPLVLPPAVSGLALLMTFGREGIFGKIAIAMGFNIPFTFIALILVQIFVMFPIFVQSLKNGFEAINQEIKEAAIIFGAGEKELLFSIYLPLSKNSFLSGIIMSCLRAAGEFGATMMFAGNLTGKTQTLSTAIYTFSQQNMEQAIALAIILILLFLLPLVILKVRLKK